MHEDCAASEMPAGRAAADAFWQHALWSAPSMAAHARNLPHSLISVCSAHVHPGLYDDGLMSPHTDGLPLALPAGRAWAPAIAAAAAAAPSPNMNVSRSGSASRKLVNQTAAAEPGNGGPSTMPWCAL